MIAIHRFSYLLSVTALTLGTTSCAGDDSTQRAVCHSADVCAPDLDDDCSGASDCSLPAVTCGDGKLDPGEACDVGIAAGEPGACPSQCNDGAACSSDELVGSGCAATCTHVEIVDCKPDDGCCPAGCNSTNDSDCSASCGNGVVDPNESCDIAISNGAPGACPTECDDAIACTLDQLVGSGCLAACSHSVITQCASGDGCCPAGCNSTNDSDCSPVCGNGVLEGGELCDPAIQAGTTGACQTSCDDGDACTADTVSGSAASCDLLCSHTSKCSTFSLQFGESTNARAIAQIADGSYFVAGKRGELAAVTRISANGQLLWQKSYAPMANAEANGIGVLDAASLIVVGSGLSDGFVLRIDHAGNVLDQRRWDSTTLSPLYLEAVSVGANRVCVAGRTSGKALIASLDTNLNLLWSRVLTATDHYSGSRANGVVTTAAGGCAVAGQTHLTSQASWVFELDATGAMLWQRVYTSSNSDTATTIAIAPGGYVVAGSHQLKAWVARLDAAGAMLWQRQVGGAASHISVARAVRLTSQGKVAMLGSTTSSGAGLHDAWLLLFSAAGTLESQRTYGGASNDGGTALAATSAGLVLAGHLGAQSMLLSLSPDGVPTGACPSGFSTESSDVVTVPSAAPSSTAATPFAATLDIQVATPSAPLVNAVPLAPICT
jgi:hypothetical protein